MSNAHETPLAEAADRRWRLMAVAMLLMGVKALISAVMFLAEPPVLRYLDWAEAATALAAAAVVLWLLFFKFSKVPASQRRHFLNMEGFVATIVHRAFKASWLTTFVTLTILGPLAHRFASLPAEFFLQALLALMLVVFSITFFVMNGPSDDEGLAGA